MPPAAERPTSIDPTALKASVPERSRLRYAGAWLTWTLCTAGGYWARSALTGAAPQFAVSSVVVPAVAVLGVIIIALLQWAALRLYVPPLRVAPWAAATLAGHLAGTLAVIVMMVGPLLLGAFGPVARIVGGPVFMVGTRLLAGALLGTVVAAAQALVLRRLGPVTRWWIVAGAAAGAVAAVPVLEAMPGERALAVSLKHLGSGMAIGSITGFGVLAVLHQRKAIVQE